MDRTDNGKLKRIGKLKSDFGKRFSEFLKERVLKFSGKTGQYFIS